MRSHTIRNGSTAHPLVLGSTRLLVALLITVLGCAGILLTQRGIFTLLGGSWQTSWPPAAVGVSLMCAAFVLARYRNDLVDD